MAPPTRQRFFGPDPPKFPFSAIFALVTYDGRLCKIGRRPPLVLPVLPKREVVL